MKVVIYINLPPLLAHVEVQMERAVCRRQGLRHHLTHKVATNRQVLLN